MTRERQTTPRNSRQAQNAARPARGASPIVLVAGLVLAAILILGAVVTLGRPSATAAEAATADTQVRAATKGHQPYPLVEAVDGTVRLPVSTLDDGKAHYYTYMEADRPVELFVLRSSDGVIRSAFNACDVCYEAKKGYTQAGDVMVCNNCGSRFRSDQINVVRGGCNPSPLSAQVEGDELVIQATDLATGVQYF